MAYRVNGARIKRLLSEQNLTYRQLDKRGDVSPQTISAVIKTGRAEVDTLCRIGKGLGIPSRDIGMLIEENRKAMRGKSPVSVATV